MNHNVQYPAIYLQIRLFDWPSTSPRVIKDTMINEHSLNAEVRALTMDITERYSKELLNIKCRQYLTECVAMKII